MSATPAVSPISRYGEDGDVVVGVELGDQRRQVADQARHVEAGALGTEAGEGILVAVT